MSIGKRLSMAAAALVLSATAALAVPAVSEADLNVRSGPGTAYPVVGVIERGASVEVSGCSGSWCRVNYGGTPGWASQRYLDIGGSAGYAAPPATVYAVPDEYDDYGYDYGAPYYTYGPSLGVQVWRGGRRGHWTHRRGRNDHVGRGNWRGPTAANPGVRPPALNPRGAGQGRTNVGPRQGAMPRYGGGRTGAGIPQRPSFGGGGGRPRMGGTTPPRMGGGRAPATGGGIPARRGG